MPEEIMVYGSAEALLAEDALSAVAFEPNEGQRTLSFHRLSHYCTLKRLPRPLRRGKGDRFAV